LYQIFVSFLVISYTAEVTFRGVMPACVTPFDQDGQVDEVGLAKLLAYFLANGCSGVVVAGTNGEGPSLSAVEKRDLVRSAVRLGDLPVILGIATPSLTEATWLCAQAGKSGAAGVLVMAPGYFRNASESGVIGWFRAVAESSPVPVIAYNFPKFTGFTFTEAVVTELATMPNVVGFKDSSGERENLAMFRRAAPDKSLLVGDETLLWDALSAGWSGSISGAANLVPGWLSRVVEEKNESVFQTILRVVESIRKGPQPAMNKAVLAEWEIIRSGAVRLPLEEADGAELAGLIQEQVGTSASKLGIPR
jgi:dihydrodipicolinate synthase/N-acetylneuraminate lyase